MTEKRFTTKNIICSNYCVWDNDDKPYGNDEVVELLNELHEERNYFERKKCEYWNKFNLAHLDNINLRKENEQLKAQLLYDGDDVCGICKHEYLAPSGDYFIGKCEKGHEECSKEDIRYCKDFELKGDVE